MVDNNDFAQRILDAALELARTRHWDAVRLRDVAERVDSSLEDVLACYPDKEALVDAWFDRADRAVQEDAADPDFLRLTPRERLHRAIMTWLDVLAPHRRATRQMIKGRLEPGRLHVQIPGAMRVARTVQLLREIVDQETGYLRRPMEDSALTSIYLMTFFYWMTDDSPGAQSTRRMLDRLLRTAETLSHFTPWPMWRERREMRGFAERPRRPADIPGVYPPPGPG